METKIGVKEGFVQVGSGIKNIGKGIGNGVKNTVTGTVTKVKAAHRQRKIDKYVNIMLEMDPDW